MDSSAQRSAIQSKEKLPGLCIQQQHLSSFFLELAGLFKAWIKISCGLSTHQRMDQSAQDQQFIKDEKK